MDQFAWIKYRRNPESVIANQSADWCGNLLQGLNWLKEKIATPLLTTYEF